MTNAQRPVYIDGVLKELGERLFWDPVRPIKGSRITTTGLSRKAKARGSNHAAPVRIANTLKNTLRRTPEVMVKISGGGKTMLQIKAHLDYISRNGQVTIEDQSGDVFSGRDEMKDIQTEWRYGGYPISANPGAKQAFNIVLSMPPGTDRESVTSAARDFAIAEFADNFTYVFATHSDEKHPHVHLCVKAMGHDGTRLNPRKADLQRWRELFADKLRDHGIEANATKRQVRGITRKPRKQAVVHLEKRGIKSFHREALQEAAAGFIRHGSPISNPFTKNIQRTRQLIISRWNSLALALQGQENLSAEIKTFVEALPPAEGLGEQLQKQLFKQLNQAKQKNKDIDR